jgi:hypothetical protein
MVLGLGVYLPPEIGDITLNEQSEFHAIPPV